MSSSIPEVNALLQVIKLFNVFSGILPWRERENSQHLHDKTLAAQVALNLVVQYPEVDDEGLSQQENGRRHLKLCEQ